MASSHIKSDEQCNRFNLNIRFHSSFRELVERDEGCPEAPPLSPRFFRIEGEFVEASKPVD